MTKWVENKDVVFTCQRDIFEYVLDKSHGVYHVKDPDKKINHFENGYFGWYSLDRHTDWVPMKRAEWYEDIPEKGVLCWVSDSGVVKKKLAVIITEYRYMWFYSSSGMPWKNACPLIKEDITQYLLPD